jgi:hypothetical protein
MTLRLLCPFGHLSPQASSLEEVTASLMNRRVFFLRTPVLVASALAASATFAVFGEFRVTQPSVPVGLFGKPSKRQ